MFFGEYYGNKHIDVNSIGLDQSACKDSVFGPVTTAYNTKMLVQVLVIDWYPQVIAWFDSDHGRMTID